LRRDVGVDEVDKLCRLGYDVERLEIVRLFAQIILSTHHARTHAHTHTHTHTAAINLHTNVVAAVQIRRKDPPNPPF